MLFLTLGLACAGSSRRVVFCYSLLCDSVSGIARGVCAGSGEKWRGDESERAATGLPSILWMKPWRLLFALPFSSVHLIHSYRRQEGRAKERRWVVSARMLNVGRGRTGAGSRKGKEWGTEKRELITRDSKVYLVSLRKWIEKENTSTMLSREAGMFDFTQQGHAVNYYWHRSLQYLLGIMKMKE